MCGKYVPLRLLVCFGLAAAALPLPLLVLLLAGAAAAAVVASLFSTADAALRGAAIFFAVSLLGRRAWCLSFLVADVEDDALASPAPPLAAAGGVVGALSPNMAEGEGNGSGLRAPSAMYGLGQAHGGWREVVEQQQQAATARVSAQRLQNGYRQRLQILQYWDMQFSRGRAAAEWDEQRRRIVPEGRYDPCTTANAEPLAGAMAEESRARLPRQALPAAYQITTRAS